MPVKISAAESFELQNVESALQILRSQGSPDNILRILETRAGGSSVQVDRSTLYRWFQKPPRRGDAARQLISVAKVFGPLRTQARFGAIRSASEHLPVLLLEKIPGLRPDIHREVLYYSSPADCMKALSSADGDGVDAIIAPRYADNGDPGIERLCKLVEIPVSGIFPVSFYNSTELVRKLKAYGKDRKPGPRATVDMAINVKLGILPNADYRTVIESFLTGFGAFLGPTHEVKNSKDAVAKFKSGVIAGVVGHKLFVENCQNHINDLTGKKRSETRTSWSDLHMAPSNLFRPVKMDVFVNIATITSEKTRAVLELLNGVLNHIAANKDEAGFINDVNSVLGFNRNSKMGKNVLREYIFEMKTFETSTLLALWKF